MIRILRLASLKVWLLSAVVAAAVLVPLYGNPFALPVTHAEWGRMLVRALDMEETLPPRAQASLVFSLLSWKSSLSFAADQYASAEGVTLGTARGRHALLAIEPGAAVSYRLAILRSGDYHLRLRLVGDPSAAVTTEISTPEAPTPVHRFAPVTPARVSTWVDVGSTHLDRGQYLATLALPNGSLLERVEVGPPCLSPVEPPAGWHATEALTTADMGVTAIQALGLESELPPADMPIEIPGSQFVVTAGAAALTAPAAALGPEAAWLKAGPQGLRAMVMIDVASEGLYTVESYGGAGRGQKWMADACRKAILCPSAEETSVPEWREILTARFSPGRHMLAVTLAPRAVVQRIRLVPKKDSPADYTATLRRLGFDVGEDPQVSRRVAVSAMDFIRGRRRQMLGLDRLCGDKIDVGVPVNIASGPAGAGGSAALPPPVQPVAPPAVVPPAPPVPPVVPPQDPSSPFTP